MRSAIFGDPLDGLRVLRDGRESRARQGFPSAANRAGRAVSGGRRHGCNRTYGGTKGFRHVRTACRRAEQDRCDRRDRLRVCRARNAERLHAPSSQRRQHMPVLPAYRLDLPYDTVTSFQAISLLATFPNLLVVNPDKVPSKTVAEFIAYLKSRPGQLNFASSGLGSSVHFAGELFKLMTKTDMQHVPYRGSAPGPCRSPSRQCRFHI